MGLNGHTAIRTGTVSPFAHLTRSPLAQALLEAEDRGLNETVALDFVGDADKAHIHTRSIRRTMGRQQRRLFYKREHGKMYLWCRFDPTIDPNTFITKPRVRYPKPRLTTTPDVP